MDCNETKIRCIWESACIGAHSAPVSPEGTESGSRSRVKSQDCSSSRTANPSKSNGAMNFKCVVESILCPRFWTNTPLERWSAHGHEGSEHRISKQGNVNCGFKAIVSLCYIDLVRLSWCFYRDYNPNAAFFYSYSLKHWNLTCTASLETHTN